ncbi:MAG TPA: terminase TerL endonuclease subunit, partial [Caulifigura sp.]|nr:terminase TerL endonuclease subunit [Caulifigura sp.]
MVDRQTAKWVRNKNDEVSCDDGCYFDLKSAERVREFFLAFLRHSKGQWADKEFEFLPWQWENLIAPLFGWKRPDGTRRYRRAGVWVPKKQGKSAICSGISLYMLIGDREPGAEIYNAAADRDQASIVFNEAANMVQKSPMLAEPLEVIRSTKRITYRATNSFYRALSADVPTKEGINWHCLIFDELHAQKSRDLWDTLVYGGAARRQPLMLSISTAGYDRHSIGYEQYSYAKGVIEDRIIDTSFFGYVAEALPEENWTDPKVWRKANPSLGVTVQEDDMAQACKEAQESPLKENAFRRYRLNQWVTQETRWLSIDKWDACDGETKLEDLIGRECFVGIDLASTTDIAAAALLFPNETGYDVLPFFWVPSESAAQREKTDRVPYRHWIKTGIIKATEGDVIDYDVIRADLNALNDTYRIREIGIDRWNATQLSTQLQSDGFEVFAFGQ